MYCHVTEPVGCSGSGECDKVVLQSATAILLQSATSVITKCEKCYYKVRKVLQSVTVHGVTFGHFSGSRTLVMVQQFMRQKLSRFSSVAGLPRISKRHFSDGIDVEVS